MGNICIKNNRVCDSIHISEFGRHRQYNNNNNILLNFSIVNLGYSDDDDLCSENLDYSDTEIQKDNPDDDDIET